MVEPDRLTALREAVAGEGEPLIVLTELLRWCRDHHRQLQALITNGSVQTALEARVDPVRRAMIATHDRSSLDDTVRGELAALFARDDDVPVVAVAQRVAELIDEQYQDSLSASFRARSPYRPGVGDPVPLGAANVTAVTTLVPTAPPWRLAHRLDQTRHVRLAGEWAAQFHVVFDYALAETGVPFLTADTVLATVHPNASMAELEFPAGTDGRVFPIGPADEARQGAQLDALIGAAVHQGATIVVLPELALTPALAKRLRHWTTDAAGADVLVAGSVHTPEGDGTRRNRALTWVRGLDHPLVHDKFSPADRPVAEAVDADPNPQIRVHVGTDGWHAVVLVCRDLLNRDAVHVLSEVGANLVLVPAMSETLTAFGGPTAQLVGANQAFVVVANNPAEWPAAASGTASPRPARAVFGHPGFGQQLRLVNGVGSEPGVATLRVASGQTQWHTAPSEDPRPEPNGTPPMPDWAARIAAENSADSPALTRPVTLRPSAVLILITSGPSGPEVLLTERATDLRDYPGRVTFPGGAHDRGDQDAIATALREAREEVGLDPDGVHVVATLPRFALPDSGFLVTPILAWSNSPSLSASTNLSEVSVARFVPLASLIATAVSPDPAVGARPWPGPRHHVELRSRLAPMTRTLIDLVAARVLPDADGALAAPSASQRALAQMAARRV